MQNISWKDVGHYGAAAGLYLLGALGASGMHIPGVTIDPATCFLAGSGVFVAGLKGGMTSGKVGPVIKSLVLFLVAIGATALALPFAGQAYAADLPVKAPVLQSVFSGYPNGKCGAYFGLNTLGGAGSVNGGAPGATIVQGDVGATLGYGCPIGNTPGNFWFAEGNFDWANLNGTQSGFALTGPAHFEQRIGLGSPISTLLNLFPSLTSGLAVPSLPALPAGVTAGPSYPFIFASLHEQDIGAQFGIAQNREWLVSPGVGLGMQIRLSDAVVAEPAVQWVLQSSGLQLGPQKVTLGNAVEASFTVKY